MKNNDNKNDIMNIALKEILKSTLSAIWFMFLTFPILVMKISSVDGVSTTIYRWENLSKVAISVFLGSFIWRYLIKNRDNENSLIKRTLKNISDFLKGLVKTNVTDKLGSKTSKTVSFSATGALLIFLPLIFKAFGNAMYFNNIMISVLIYIILGLGLNIVVGYGGLLHLGYAAFYAVGAYSYALFFNFLGPKLIEMGVAPGMYFWISIPIAIISSLVFGILLCLPVIRLRGDYLAIVTLAFGEITRMVLENWGNVTQGPSGISQIPRAWVPEFLLGGKTATNPIAASYILYFIALAFVVISIIVVKNMENSRLGRAWEAMREDEIACQSMGIDLTKAKLKSFALGALWAGIAGVLLATKTTFVNPASFTLWESVLILCVIVLGGMGSIPGVVVGSLLMILLPEVFRGFSEYRMLIFGLALVLMMLFKPDGIIPRVRKKFTFRDSKPEGGK